MVSVQPRPWPPVPQVTARAARAAAGKGVYPLAMRVRDELGEVFPDVEFESGFGQRGHPGWSPGRLALITVLQMAENLTDRGAAERIRFGLDWKYALGLEIEDPGIDHSVLSEFRTRVVEHGLEEKVLDLLLARLVEVGLLGRGGKARTDSTHVISAVRDLNRLELAGESVRAALEALAVAAPHWLAAVIDVSAWSGRYTARVDSWRLPSSETRRTELALAYARDGYALIDAVYDAETPVWIRQVEAVQVLRVVLLQNYTRSIDEQGREVVTRREADVDGLPPGRSRLASPYDTDARWGGQARHLLERVQGPPDRDLPRRPRDQPGRARPDRVAAVPAESDHECVHHRRERGRRGDDREHPSTAGRPGAQCPCIRAFVWPWPGVMPRHADRVGAFALDVDLCLSTRSWRMTDQQGSRRTGGCRTGCRSGP